MKISIKPPTEFEAQNIEADKHGIRLEPVFYQPKGKATGGIIEVTGRDGSIVFRGLLTISGQTGAVSVDPRTKPVTPSLDKALNVKKKESGK